MLRERRPVTEKRPLFAVLSLLLWATPPASAGIVNGPGPRQGQIDFTVYFRFPPTPAQLEDFQDRVQAASELLCDATDGEIRFGRVTITGGYNHDVGLEDADVWVVPYIEGGVSYATSLGFAPGEHVALYYGNDFQSSSLAIAHELSHLALTLGDEYANPDRLIGPCIGIGEPAAATTGKNCLMQVAPFLNGVQQEIDESLCDELCTNLVHDLVAGDDPALPGCTADAEFNGCARPEDGGADCAGKCCLFNFDVCSYEGTDHNYRRIKAGEPVRSCWSQLQAVFPWVGGPGPSELPDDAVPGGCSAAVDFTVDDLAAANQVMLVLDRSYSMAFDPDAGQDCQPDCPEICDEPGETDCNNPALDFLKQSASLYLAMAQSDPEAEAGVVAFSSGSSLKSGLKPIGANIVSLEGAVNGLAASGNTNIGGALLRARDELAGGGAGTKAVFLITDGIHNVPEEDGGVDPLEAAEALFDEGIRVFLVTTGDAANDEVLGSIVDTTGGKLLRTPNPRDLVSALGLEWAHHNNVGIVIPKLRYKVYRQEPLPEPAAMIRSPDEWLDGKDGPPPFPYHSNRFRFDVEEGAGAVSIIIAGTLEKMAGFGPRVVLTGPGGPNPNLFDTQIAGPQPFFSVERRKFFHLLRIDQPNPGPWTAEVSVLDVPDVAPIQEGTVTVLVSNPRTLLLTSINRRVVFHPAEKVRLSVTPVFRSALRNPKVLEARVFRPDGTSAVLPLDGGRDLELSFVGEIDDFPMAGQYEVRVRLATGPSTTRHPGETIFAPAPQAVGGVPQFERTAVETFLVAFGPKHCPGPAGDCDADSIPDRLDPLDTDTDRDGLPDGCDRDADGDEIPDGYDPPTDSDQDRIPDHQDPDADNDGLPDGDDPSTGPGDVPYRLRYPEIDLPVDCGGERHAPVLLSSERPVTSVELDVLWRPTEQVEIAGVSPGAGVDPDQVESFEVKFEVLSPSTSRAVVKMTFKARGELEPGIGIELLDLAFRARPGAPVGSFAPLLPSGAQSNVLMVIPGKLGASKVFPQTTIGRADLVADTTPPVIQAPAVLELIGREGCCARIEVAPKAFDDCDGEVPVRIAGGRLPLELCGTGYHAVTWTAVDSHGNQSWLVVNVQIHCGAGAGGGGQAPGDCNQDSLVNIADPVCLLGYMFLGEPRSLACGDGSIDSPGNVALLDWSGDGRLDLTDPVGELGFLFLGGPPHPLLKNGRCVQIEGCPAACRR